VIEGVECYFAPDHTQWHTHTHTHTHGRTPLDEGSARCREIHLTTHNTHKRQTSMPPAGFKTVIPAREWPNTNTLDRVTTGSSLIWNMVPLDPVCPKRVLQPVGWIKPFVYRNWENGNFFSQTPMLTWLDYTIFVVSLSNVRQLLLMSVSTGQRKLTSCGAVQLLINYYQENFCRADYI
jgi:hypothetical protein